MIEVEDRVDEPVKENLKVTFQDSVRHYAISAGIAFLSLCVLTGIVLMLLYFKALAFLPPETSDAVLRAVINDTGLILAVLFVAALMAAWFLSYTSLSHRLVKKRLSLNEQVLTMVNDLVYVYDYNGNCIYASQANARNGLSHEECKARNKTTYKELVKPRMKDLVEAGELTFESIYRRMEKPPVPIEVYCRIIESGYQNFVLSIIHDITERKRTEAELQQSSERLRIAMNGTINSMAYIAEARDPYTAGHQQRVAKLATALAKEMSISEEQIEGIRVAGILHDIGKISVPAEILSKPGRLRKSEFNLVKEHSEVGYSLLKAIAFSQPVAQIVLQHHERMDGSGYPSGLTGEDIMIEARIMAIADVIESMSSHRPYRPAYNIDKALLEIVMQKGILYDPAVVDACVRLFNEKGFTFN
jgi:putative nucleotidyltransferase with HDIG domain/PAS domain S-box-containing protein